MKLPQENETCPVARAVAAVGDRWAMLIVRDAFDGASRFGDFQRRLGVARNILSDRLRTLVELDILALRPAADGSAYQEYVLTEKGADLFPLIVALRQWGERHLFAEGEARSALVEKETGLPLAAMWPRTQGGNVVESGAAVVRKPGR